MTDSRDAVDRAGELRRWLQPEIGRGSGNDEAYFAGRGDLVRVATRAARSLRGETVSFLDAHEGVVRRVVVEVSDAQRRTACLVVCAEEPPFGLTPRELQVATCIAGGLSNPQIAEALACSRRTVATHVEHVLAKTGVAARASVATLLADHDAYAAPLPRVRLTLPARLSAVLCGSTLPRDTGTRRQRPVVLGAVYPSGCTAGADAAAMRRGARLAVGELNARGGAGGRRVEQVAVEAAPDALRGAVEDLAARGADAILFGNFPMKVAHPAITEAAATGAPVLHSMTGQALSDAVHEDPAGLGAVFQVCSTESAYVPGLLRAVHGLEATGAYRPRRRRLAVLLRESTYSDRAVEQVQRSCAEAGWELGLLRRIPDHTEDFTEIVRALADADPDALSLSVLPEPTLRALLRATRELAGRMLIHAAWSPAAPEFTGRFGELSEGLLWSTVIGHAGGPVCAEFEQRYRSAYGGDPGLGAAAVHYDMVNLLAQAWGRVSRPWEFRAVRDHLRSMTWFGVTGAHRFAGRGQRGLSNPDDTPDPTLAHPHLVYRIQGGRSRQLAAGAVPR
ncbi:ABC transporter substrate-binding protein [Sciscionella sediminilitoris]|uniref:ABC transporter substrate-binding protein n=1 Tax=Sciscionella sediminilitoris TaxID=1445613 RepID=UPI00068B7AF4|nr:ABC transporter substrate-binding protein [Sciscionella sp. SE31]